MTVISFNGIPSPYSYDILAVMYAEFFLLMTENSSTLFRSFFFGFGY